jgi:hypothetical protein
VINKMSIMPPPSPAPPPPPAASVRVLSEWSAEKGGGKTLSTRGATFQGLLTALLILTLLAAVGLLLTERNQRRYFLRSQPPFVLVDRGLPLPYGHGPYHPSDPQLAKAYQAFRLPTGVAAPAEDESFDDRAELDQRLGDLLLAAAKARLAATDEGHLQDGMAYLAQLDSLGQLSGEQRRGARALRSEVAYVEASDELGHALAALRDVEGLLKLGADSANAHTKDSADLLDRLTPAVDSVVRAARGQGVAPADSPELAAPAPDGGAKI